MRILLFFLLTILFEFAYSQDPDPPTITHVSIDSISQQVHLYWYNNAPQAIGYVVYVQDASGLWIPLDTVMGAQNLSYTTQASNAQFEEESYSVTAFDALGNSSNRSEAHTTLSLRYNYSLCDTLCQLQWNLYPVMLNQIGFILRVHSKDLQDTNIQTEDIQFSVFDTTYAFPVAYNKKYTFTVLAKNSLDSLSRSNRFSISTTQLIPPDYVYINKVDVTESNDLEINMITNSTSVSYFQLFRTPYETGVPEFISNVELAQNSLSASYLDEDLFPEESTYHYSANAIDECGNTYALPSLPDTSYRFSVHQLQLNSQIQNSEIMSISWGSYPFFIEEEAYGLWLEINGRKEFIRSVEAQSNDEIDIKKYRGVICAYVTAYEQQINNLALTDTVNSNKVCFIKEPIVHIPNAFTPQNGDVKNNYWQASFEGIDVINDFDLKIYNSWGILVVHMKDASDFWDGSINGILAPQGTYTYQMLYTFGNGLVSNKNGTLHLLR